MMYFSKEELVMLIESVEETYPHIGDNKKADNLVEKLKHQLETME